MMKAIVFRKASKLGPHLFFDRIYRIILLILSNFVGTLTSRIVRRPNSVFCFLSSVFYFLGSALNADVTWTLVTGLPNPNSGGQQTACLVLDIDKDGINDFVVTERTRAPSVLWYKFNGSGWNRYVVEDQLIRCEAGGTYYDIDRDGDMDIVFGNDSGGGNRIYWWENPYPDYGNSWKRYEIKNSGGNKHHDQIIADFDGDGDGELVSWNQGSKRLLYFEIPFDPKSTPWLSQAIFNAPSGSYEGLAAGDIDLDGKLDIVGAGRWFKHIGGSNFRVSIIDSSMNFTRAAVGQLVEGGWPEVLFAPGDANGDAKWYEWKGSAWVSHTLRYVTHGHTVDICDVDRDGNLDIFIGEMGSPGAGNNAKTWIYYGNGRGQLVETVARTGQGIHEGKLEDLDGDGDLDILFKPYHHNAPLIEVLLSAGASTFSLDQWERHEVDALPWQAMFVTAGDIDGDGDQDIITGGWWYANPGIIGGNWLRHTIGGMGSPLKNMAVVHDFDADGDLDVLGTEGQGSSSNSNFRWAMNNGSGSFTVFGNVSSGDGDFLQGAAVGKFEQGHGGSWQVALSWHQANKGVQLLTAPTDPSSGTWSWNKISDISQDEHVSAGDIDTDGDLDLLLGTKWLRNNSSSWSVYTLGSISDLDPDASPDRNSLVDINGDGRLDAVITLEQGTDVIWFRAPQDPTSPWTRYIIGNVSGQGFSMDVGDFDLDGDPDVVLGEHRGDTDNRVIIFENNGSNSSWPMHIIDTDSKNNIDHHDGTRVVDIDADGDLDIISIGWYNPKLWIYENKPAVISIINNPPEVDAGPGQTVSLLQLAFLDGTVIDDGKPLIDPSDPSSLSIGLTTWWAKIIGPAEVSFGDPCAVDTTVAFTKWGTYKLRLSAHDGQLWAHDDVYVTVEAPGDLDWDNDVDFADLSLFVERWPDGGCDLQNNWCGCADLNSDSRVDMNDFAYLANYWQTSIPDGLMEGLVAHFKFDDAAGDIAYDSSGNGHDGTIFGATWSSPGAGTTGWALDFDGADDLVELGKFDVVGSGITLAGWIKANDFGIPDGRIISKAQEWNDDDHWWMLSTISATQLRFRLKTNEAWATATLISDSVLQAGIWTHVAATWDGSVMRLYKDGVEIASMHKGGTAVAVDPDVSVAIGSQPANAYDSDPKHTHKYFDGIIDDVRVYNRALNDEEIQTLAGL